MLNRIERGASVQAQDGALGEVYQVVVDPDTKDLTHIVVRPSDGRGDLMIPVNLVAEATGSSVTLTSNMSDLESMRDQISYDAGQFQPVNPATVTGAEAPTASGTQTILDADNNTVEFGSQGTSPMSTGSTMSTAMTDTSSTTTEMAAGEGQPVGVVGERKGKDLVGLPVMSLTEGEKIGDVKDVLFDPEQNRVVALLTDSGGWFKSAKVVPWEMIKTVGYESIIVSDRSAEIPADTDAYIKRVLETDNILLGTEVYTDDGRHIGKIGDMFVDDSTGEIVGYEVSGGMFNSTLKGKKFMPAPDTITMGKDVAFVPAEVGDAMQEQTGGLQAATQNLTSTAGGGAAGGLLDTVKEQTSQLTQSVSSSTAAQRDQQLEASIGRTVGSDVYADDGTAIALQGTVVDPMTIERARAYGKENQLLSAVGTATVQEAATQAKDSISGAFSGIRAKFEEMTAQQREERERKRINNALGRPVNRVILDQQDNVILDTAQIITNEAIDRARAAGVLDILLDSAYEVDFDLSPEALHSGQSGQAAIPSNFETQRKPEDPIT